MPSTQDRNVLKLLLSDKDLEEVACKTMTKVGLDINTSDIEDCHSVRIKG